MDDFARLTSQHKATEKTLALPSLEIEVQFCLNQRVPMWGMIPEKRLTCHIEDLFVYQSLPCEPTHTRCRDGLEMLHAVIEFIAVNI